MRPLRRRRALPATLRMRPRIRPAPARPPNSDGAIAVGIDRSIEVLDFPHPRVASQLDRMPALNLNGSHVARYLNLEPVRLFEAVDERAQIAFDRASRGGRQHAHQRRVASPREGAAQLLERFA